MGDCSICCEKLNLSNHKKVQCPFCDFNACRECVQTYLVSTINDPHCMSCKKEWNREFVDSSCTKVFRNGKLKKHRENILVEREKCLLPQTQTAVKLKMEERRLEQLLFECKNELRRQKALQHTIENNLWRVRSGNSTIHSEQNNNSFVRKCPMENCKGFLGSRWTCGICETKICSKCNEPKTEDHTCDPNNVETVAMLNKDTKPCPSCGTMIFKISGCSQMWCPECHNAFNWNTGRIESGIIHNPHYYEFMRRTNRGGGGRNLGDIPCGGLPTLGEMIRYFSDSIINENDENVILTFHRVTVHIDRYEIRNYTWHQQDNSDLRIKYLMDELDEENWKSLLQQREKGREKYRDISNVLRMFIDTSGDFYRQMIVGELNGSDCCESLYKLKEYFNDAMTIVHKRYNCVTPYISDKINIVSNTYRANTTI